MSSLAVSQIMRTRLIASDVGDTLEAVSRIMLDENVGLILIKDGDRIVGVITKNDLLRAIDAGKDFAEVAARDIMSTRLVTCALDDSLEKALSIFEKENRSRLLVLQGEEVAGVLYRKVAERFAVLSRYYSVAKRTSAPLQRTRGR